MYCTYGFTAACRNLCDLLLLYKRSAAMNHAAARISGPNTKTWMGNGNMLEKALQRDIESRPFEKEMKKFGEILLKEPNLLDQLDKTTDKHAFIELYCKLARDRGISFSKDDLLIAVQEQKHGKNWILPKPVLMMVREKF